MNGFLSVFLKSVWHTARASIVVIILAGLLVSNIMTLANAKVYDALYGALEYASSARFLKNSKAVQQRDANNVLHERGKRIKALNRKNKEIASQNKSYKSQLKVRKDKVGQVKSISKRIASRTVRNVSTNLSSMIGEATPYVGIALVAASTAVDVVDGCETVRDVNQILRLVDEQEDIEGESEICGKKVPSADQLASKVKEDIGGTIFQAKENMSRQGKEAYDALGGTIYHSKERLKNGGIKFYNDLGGTIYEVFH